MHNIRNVIDHALISADIYEDGVRQSGRTTRLIQGLEHEDVVVAYQFTQARAIAQKVLKERGICVYPLSLDELMRNTKDGFVIRGVNYRSWHKVKFDSTAILELFKMKLNELQKFVDKGIL